MISLNNLDIVWSNIRNRPLRTGLTILGIVIAIATIGALFLLSEGLEKGIAEQFGKIGSNRVYIAPAGSSISSFQTGLTEEDAELLKSIAGVRWVNPYLQERVIVEYDKQTVYVTVWATQTDSLEKRWEDIDYKIYQGRIFTEQDTNAAILGYKFATELFDREIKVNENIMINDKKFHVVGIFEEIGNPEDDNVIEIPLDTAQELLGKGEMVSIIELVIEESGDSAEIGKEAKERLERKKGEDTIDTVTPDQLLKQLSAVTLIIDIVLGAIAGISLVVGAVGITNAMYTSVLERKKDIGIMKAVGAKNTDIFFLFVAEAGSIGIIGGMMGGFLGYGIAKGAEYSAHAAGFELLKIAFDPFIFLGGVAFAGGIGMIAGFFPAREAMKKQIIEALRKS